LHGGVGYQTYFVKQSTNNSTAVGAAGGTNNFSVIGGTFYNRPLLLDDFENEATSQVNSA
jgi:hypothetical protein